MKTPGPSICHCVHHGPKTWTQEQFQWLLNEMKIVANLKEADNRKLLWLAMNTKSWKSLDVVGIEADIFTELETRLYPEYDGETVTFEEWGWKTPDGEIRYLTNVANPSLEQEGNRNE